ncbi:MAG: hypothetical protein JO180_03705 [Gemmatirosa sp.]|nr:hypothetical protein [Gemmatirosa sp.]
MPAWQLRPRSAPELVDASVQLVREHARPLLTLGVLLVIPGLALSLLNALVLGGSLIPTANDAVSTPWASFALLLPGMLVAMCWFLVAFGAMVASASAAYTDGVALEPLDALRRVGGRAATLVGSGVLTYLLVTVQLLAVFLAFGLVAAIVAGAFGAFSGLAAMAGSRGGGAAAGVVAIVTALAAIVIVFAAMAWLVGRYAVLPAVSVNERLGVVASMRRARMLASGSARRITLLLMLVFVLFAVVAIGTLALFALALRNAAASAVAASVVNVPIYTFLGALGTVLYYDLRIRHEGLDIELLVDELAPPPNAEAAAR